MRRRIWAKNHHHSLKVILYFTQIELEAQVKVVVVEEDITIIKITNNSLMIHNSVKCMEEDTLEEGVEVVAVCNDKKLAKDVNTFIDLVIKRWTTIRSKMI